MEKFWTSMTIPIVMFHILATNLKLMSQKNMIRSLHITIYLRCSTKQETKPIEPLFLLGAVMSIQALSSAQRLQHPQFMEICMEIYFTFLDKGEKLLLLKRLRLSLKEISTQSMTHVKHLRQIDQDQEKESQKCLIDANQRRLTASIMMLTLR